MKKLLSILSSVGLLATTSATVVACGNKNDNKAIQPNDLQLLNKEPINIIVTDPTKIGAEEKDSIISQADQVINPRIKEMLKVAKVSPLDEAKKPEDPEYDVHYTIEGLVFKDNLLANTQVTVKAKEDKNLLIGESDKITLNFITDKKVLQETIKVAEELIKNTSEPVEGSVEVLQLVINEAQDIVNKVDATIEEVNATNTKLVKAIQDFKDAQEKVAIDKAKEVLTNKISEAQGLIIAENKDTDYAKALQAVIDEAQDIVNKNDATKTEIEDANTKLVKAIQDFKDAQEKVAIDKAKEVLTNKISEAQGLIIAENKDTDYAKALQAVIDEAQDIVNKNDATKTEIEGANTKLVKAIQDFKDAQEKVAIDKAKEVLTNKISEAQGLIIAENKDTDYAKALQAVIDEAQDIVNKNDATKTEIEGANTKLVKAIQDFKDAQEKVAIDKAKEVLTSKIDEAQGLIIAENKDTDYAKALQAVIDEAQDIVNKNDATKTEIEDANTKLVKAIQDFKDAQEKVAIDKAKEVLTSKIDEAQDLIDITKNSSIEQLLKQLKGILNEAEGINANQDATKSEVDTINQKLADMIEKFIDAHLGKARLNLGDLIKSAYSLISATKDATEGSVKVLEEVIDQAQEILDQVEVSRDWLINTININARLSKAIEDFKDAQDPTELGKLISEANDLMNETNFDAKSSDDLKGAIAEAKKAIIRSDNTMIKLAKEKLANEIQSFINLHWAKAEKYHNDHIKVAEKLIMFTKNPVEGTPEQLRKAINNVKDANKQERNKDSLINLFKANKELYDAIQNFLNQNKIFK